METQEIKTRKCSNCKEVKPLTEFYKNKTQPEGRGYLCHDCAKSEAMKYYYNNKEKSCNKHKEWVKKNSDYVKEKRKEYYEINKEILSEKHKTIYKDKITKRRLKNRDKINEKSREWNRNHRETSRKYEKKKKETDKLYRLRCSIRSIVGMLFSKNKYIKKEKTNKILGCSFEFLKMYLESKFESWMSWDNHGKYNGQLGFGWDIDHIIPMKEAITEEDVLRLNHYTNLQPLDSYINRCVKKGNAEYYGNIQYVMTI